MRLSFKRTLIIGTQKGEKRLKMNKKMYDCWLSIERRLYLVCQRHHLLYVGVVMSSCSPLVMLLMGINAIIWLLIQISLRIQSEQTHRRSMGGLALSPVRLWALSASVSRNKKHTHTRTHVNIIVLLEAEEDLIICRGNVSKHARISVGAQTNLKNMSRAEGKKWKQGCCTVDAVQNQEAVKWVARKKRESHKNKANLFSKQEHSTRCRLIFLSWMNSGKREAFDLFSATDISLTVCGQISFKRRYRLH